MLHLHLHFCPFLPFAFTQPSSLLRTEVGLKRRKMHSSLKHRPVLKSFASPEQFIGAEFK